MLRATGTPPLVRLIAWHLTSAMHHCSEKTEKRERWLWPACVGISAFVHIRKNKELLTFKNNAVDQTVRQVFG